MLLMKQLAYAHLKPKMNVIHVVVVMIIKKIVLGNNMQQRMAMKQLINFILENVIVNCH